MDDETKQLVALAKENPWRLFGCAELAKIMDADGKLITAINKATDTPFIGKKCRPEWVTAWLQSHGGFVAK